MTKKRGSSGRRGSIIGVVGGVLIGAAILLFVAMMVLTNLKAIEPAGGIDNSTSGQVRWAEWNATNATVDTIITFLTICVVLLGVLGITIIGSHIIGYISAGFG